MAPGPLLTTLTAAVSALLVCTANAQTSAGQLPAGRWIPTDLNYALISKLRASSLSNPTELIEAYATLGVIPVDIVGQWINALNQNPTFRDGTVRWNPSVPTKCAYNRTGCTKSVKVTVLEYSFANPDASDCLAYALVAADAILPQQALLASDLGVSFQPAGPVNYEILAAPNATNGSCTYVVQYPRNTQLLANQLCDETCFNSPCQPCNAPRLSGMQANQTITGPDIPTDCLPTSGISPQLVAAIQGAGMCLAVGPVGRFTCQIRANQSTCAQMACFPGDASITVEGQGTKLMRELQIGDRVQVVQPDGTLAWDDIYFFGHRDHSAVAEFVRLMLESGSDRKAIELSGKHFIPASRSSRDWRLAPQVRARDVSVNDFVWAEADGGVKAFRVVGKHSVTKAGLWAPYTATGSIVVNGVAASVHSDWYLDGIFDALGRSDLLPLVYQVLLLPLRLLYQLLGSAWMRAADNWLRLESIVLLPESAHFWQVSSAVLGAFVGAAGLRAVSRK